VLAVSANERLARWTAPLEARVDARAHSSFELVRTETAKLESPSGGPPDWSAVLDASDAFLTEVGRDLVVGAALASALAIREGFGGAALGASTLARLLMDPTLTPPRARARANALAWYVARTEIALDGAKDRTRSALDALDAALDELSAAATSTLGDDAPTTRSLKERVQRALASLPAPAPPPSEPAPAAIFAPPPPLPSVASAPAETLPDRPEQVPAFVRRISTQLVSAAALARSVTPLDADAIRTTLVALYLPIASAPETTRDRRTALPAPPKLVLETLRKHQGTPETLVRDALAAIERSRFALDVHLALASALDRAGAERAASAHRHEVVGLLARLPELLEREFADGTPFASAEARATFDGWLAPAPTPIASLAPEESPTGRIRALARQGRVADALAAGRVARDAASSVRSRFELTLSLAIVAEDARATSLAAELHLELLELMDRHALDAWDPLLAAETLRSHLRLARSATPETLARPLFARLARLDPAAAFEIARTNHATPAKTGR
jgi:type VI secretion system protein VasJ